MLSLFVCMVSVWNLHESYNTYTIEILWNPHRGVRNGIG